MRRWLSLLCLWLAGCAGAPLAEPPLEHLFHDGLFAAASERIDVGDVFALNDEMKRYLRTEITASVHAKGRQRALVDALASGGALRLQYDTAMTRNAAQAFDARAGNCLSLVIMTAAFAKALDLPVSYQSAYTEEIWSRGGELYLRSRHVNLTLGRRLRDAGTRQDFTPLTIDFLPAEEIRGLRTHEISERTVIAMYLNNRAAESLVGGRVAQAYWWAREAIRHSPAFLPAVNTLGVVYLRRGEPQAAEQAFAHVLQGDPANTHAMFNLAKAYARSGRVAEANALYRALARIEPDPPFHYFDLGRAAMERGDYRAAREMFAKEVDRAEYYHEFHFWLAMADFRLGNLERARKHLHLAMENSTTGGERDLYAAKLAALRAHR